MSSSSKRGPGNKRKREKNPQARVQMWMKTARGGLGKQREVREERRFAYEKG